MLTKKVSVVIPVYGQWHLVKRNVDNLLEFDRNYIAEIIIVDDCSPTQNPYDFEDVVSVVHNSSNKGYSGTVNNGLKRAISDIIVLLDSDAYPICPFIENLLSVYDSDDTIGCVGFGTVDDNGERTGSYTYEPSLLSLIVGQQLEVRLNLKGSNKILPFSCSVSFRKSCLQEMAYFNELDFPVLDADLDISMRIHRSRWKLLFNENIIVSHMGGNSYKINYKRVLLFHESRWRLLREHGIIVHPNLAKVALNTRIRLELIALYLLRSISKNDKEKYREKAEGRKILLEKSKNYK
jgi:GT2 family glycosyltransferase